MSKQAISSANDLRKTPLERFWIKFKKNWQLHLMMIMPLAYLLLFEYGPMFGLQIAFKEYRPKAGIWNSDWVGLKHLVEFFQNRRWIFYVRNTITISLYSIAAGFPMPIILALILHINENKVLTKITQNVSYLPHFLSAVVLVGLIRQLFDPYIGIFVILIKALGVEIVGDFRTEPDSFYHLYVWSGVWQGLGWGAIMYVAALAGVSPELHEAAKIDGASRVRRVFAVDIPAILPTICMMLILRFGSVMSVGYEKVYLMQYSSNIERSEVISTYVYKEGLGGGRLSFGTAVGLLNSVINTCMIVLVNWITDRLSEGENSLF